MNKFTSDDFIALCLANNAQLQPSGFESHNAIGNGEQYHEYLRQVFNCVFHFHIDADRHHILRLATKEVKDTAGPNGLVHTLLLFGNLPRLLINTRELPTSKPVLKLCMTPSNR